jgi:hypothetical protein
VEACDKMISESRSFSPDGLVDAALFPEIPVGVGGRVGHAPVVLAPCRVGEVQAKEGYPVLPASLQRVSAEATGSCRW